MKRDPLVEIEVGIQGDIAVSLGYAGRKLKTAIGDLRACDEGRPGDRKVLAQRAADALWGYVVQRELLGVTDSSDVTETFGVPSELWRRMGASP